MYIWKLTPMCSSGSQNLLFAVFGRYLIRIKLRAEPFSGCLYLVAQVSNPFECQKLCQSACGRCVRWSFVITNEERKRGRCRFTRNDGFYEIKSPSSVSGPKSCGDITKYLRGGVANCCFLVGGGGKRIILNEAFG